LYDASSLMSYMRQTWPPGRMALWQQPWPPPPVPRQVAASPAQLGGRPQAPAAQLGAVVGQMLPSFQLPVASQVCGRLLLQRGGPLGAHTPPQWLACATSHTNGQVASSAHWPDPLHFCTVAVDDGLQR